MLYCQAAFPLERNHLRKSWSLAAQDYNKVSCMSLWIIVRFVMFCVLASVVSETAHPAMLVKCRIANSFEEDFVEVEVPSLTYSALLQSCCEELEVESTTVAKIRKLPNTLVRKDRDVMRLNSLQELELVLHTALV